jgi:peptidoglycan/xylan/chitin deacetylase (PgdA/CDA1 family)
MPRPVHFVFNIAFVFFLLLTAACQQGKHEKTPTSGAQVLLSTPPPAVDIPILMYHKVDTFAYSRYWVSDRLFDRQMAALQAYGYKTITLADFLDYRAGKITLPEHPIIITFDDGYQDFYTQAVPILKSKGLSATVFLPTGKIGTSEKDRQNNSWDSKEAVYPANHLIWDEVRAFVREGFQVGSHTVTHPDLASIPESQIKQELSGSRSDLQDKLGLKVDIFCFPGGSGAADQAIQSDLQEAGYTAAVTTFKGFANTATSNIYSLPRLIITEQNSVVLDPTQPALFFMRKVDPNFPIPIISISKVEFLGRDGLPEAAAAPGDSVMMKITLKSRGAVLPVQISVKLMSSSEHSIVVYFKQTLQLARMNRNAKTYNFNVPIPKDSLPGQNYYAITINDQQAVLEFASSGWKEAFLVQKLLINK